MRLRAFMFLPLLALVMSLPALAQLQWQIINTPWTLRDPSLSSTRLNAPIRSMNLSNSNGNISLWVSGINGNFRTSSANGASWDSTKSTNGGFISVAQRSSSFFTLSVNAGSKTSILRSTDNGTNWLPTSGQVSSEDLNNIVSNGRVLVVSGVAKGLYISADDGNNWRFADVAQNCTMLQVIGSTIYAGTADGLIFRTNDDGASWENLGCACSGVRSLTTVGNTLVVGGSGGVCVSTDAGSTWINQNNGLYAQHISALVTVNNTVYAASEGKGVYRTLATGHTAFSLWQPVNSGLGNLMVSDMLLWGSRLYVGTQNGIYTADLGGTVSVENTSDETLRLFPNPAGDIAYIELPADIASELRVRISDVLGNEVYSLRAAANAAQVLALPTEHLANGSYTVYIQVGEHRSSRQLIIAH